MPALFIHTHASAARHFARPPLPPPINPPDVTLYFSLLLFITGEISRIVFQNTATNHHVTSLFLPVFRAHHPLFLSLSLSLSLSLIPCAPIRSIVPRESLVYNSVYGRSSIISCAFRTNFPRSLSYVYY